MTFGLTCNKCSIKVRRDARFCPKCGERLVAPKSVHTDGSPDPVAQEHSSTAEASQFARTDERPEAGTNSAESPPGTCPICGYPNHPGASICERCSARMWLINREKSSPAAGTVTSSQSRQNLGASVASGAVPASRAASQRAQSVPARSTYTGDTSCERCGAQNAFGAPSCINCGLPFRHESPDGVPAAVSHLGNPAGFWIRFLAVVIDSAIVFGIGAMLWPLLFGEAFWITETRTTAEGRVISIEWRTQNWHTLMWLLYSIFFLGLLGATPAKMIFNLRVYDGRGRRGIGFVRATVRTFSTWLSAITLLIGFIMVGFRKDKRALHDLIAGTYPTSRW